MKLRNLIKENTTGIILELELWNISAKIGDFRKSKRKRHNKERKTGWLEKRRVTISTATLNGPDQNAINLTNIELSDACNKRGIRNITKENGQSSSKSTKLYGNR